MKALVHEPKVDSFDSFLGAKLLSGLLVLRGRKGDFLYTLLGSGPTGGS